MRFRVAVFGLVAITLLHSERYGAAQSPPDDFSFRFDYGLCTTDVLDTFKGVFIRDMGSHDPPVLIPLLVPAASRDTIYDEIVAAKFVDYPEVFKVLGSSGFAPAMHYRLEVQVSGARHSVSWTDGVRPSTPEADRLRALFAKIIASITSQPEVMRLPSAKIGCA